MTESDGIFGGEEEAVAETKRYTTSAMEYTTEEKRLLMVERLHKDRHLAHHILFSSRRKNVSPEFHEDILNLFYSASQLALATAFRGGAKSTLVEEFVVLSLLFKESRFAIIIGNSYERACERLAAIKHELETNEAIVELFGPQVGPTWSVDVIVLSNGARVQAFGAKQSLRGAKTAQGDRPDLAVVDDLEDEDMVLTEQARHKLRRWFDGSMRPALIPTGKVRMVGTPLHPKCLLEALRSNGQWKCLSIPILYLKDGKDTAAWPDRFPLDWINKLRQNYIDDGAVVEFEQEYMCRAEDVESKPFQGGMFKAGARPAGYHAVDIIVDPARTTNTKTSARTGYAAVSWIGSKMYVLAAYGRFHKPDEIVAEIVRLNDEYNPVAIGVEADGLEEFIMQPLRNEQIKLGVSIPIIPLRAPNNKDAFISGLQPFYAAGDVIHAGDCKDLEQELVAFPTGRRDVPNALAYAPRMRSGRPVYEDFGPQHIIPGLDLNRRAKKYLAVSATPSMTAAALLQYRDNNLYVLQDWVRNEPALEALPIILQEATLAAGEFITVTPAEQMDKYNNNGIPSVFRGRRNKIVRGKLASQSIGSLVARLKLTNKGVPAFQVNASAHTVVNGMARGYCRKLLTTGSYADFPEKNKYALVMEAIESFTGYLNGGMIEEDDELTRSLTPSGREYFSTLPQRGH